MVRIPLYGVEYQTESDTTTYEIFKDEDDARKFTKTVVAIYLFIADFDADSVEMENGQLNYHDHSELYENLVIIEEFITPQSAMDSFYNLIDSFVDDDDILKYDAEFNILTDYIKMLEHIKLHID